MKTRNLLAITSIILLAVISRVIPHPPNFAPITAIALLGSVYYKNKWQSIFIPIIIMFVSDLIIGLHGTIPFVYGAFLLITLVGFWLKKHFSYKNLLIVTLLSSVSFFLITNFGVWLVYDMYPKTFSGLIEAYVMAIPFFRNTLLGDLLYTSVLFGAVELMKRYNIISTPQHA